MADQELAETSLVLVVDDDPMIRVLVTEILQQIGFAVEQAENGREALDFLEHCQPDVVLLDVLMPEMDGQQTYMAMSEINPDIKAILATGYSMNRQARAMLDEGAMGFVQKPFDMISLSKKVAQVLQSK